MKTYFQKNENQFIASMILNSTTDINNKENLKKINSYFINKFMKYEKLLAKNQTELELLKSQPKYFGFAIASGNNRAEKVIELALSTLTYNDKLMVDNVSILLLISSINGGIDLDEIGLINDSIQEKADFKASITMDVSEDENLGEAIAVAILIS
ncbi:MAG: hypothetical protein I4O51_13075 [Flavobacterium micromati]|jgi:cell division GTPase FtsZ|nr:hypothetical protein [Flavobacterium micromati]